MLLFDSPLSTLRKLLQEPLQRTCHVDNSDHVPAIHSSHQKLETIIWCFCFEKKYIKLAVGCVSGGMPKSETAEGVETWGEGEKPIAIYLL